MPSPLLALPRELRDKIYDTLWLHTPQLTLHTDPTTSQIQISYASSPSAPTPLPTWLLTSKQILAEASAQMIRHGTWTVRLRSDYNGASMGSVLSPVFARRLTVTLTQPLEAPRTRWPHVIRDAVLRPSKEDAECLRRLVGHVAGGRVREVRVVLESVREERGARVDLEALGVLGGLGLELERLEVVVVRERIYRAYTEDFIGVVGAEVRRVGGGIMRSDEEPRVSGGCQDGGVVYAFEKAGGMALCRVDSAVGGC